MRKLSVHGLLAAAALVGSPAAAVSIFAENVIEFFDSGAGPLPGPYGGDGPNFPIPVELGLAADRNADTHVSLPTGSFLTLGFDEGVVVDGDGNDLFISEPGAANENADVFVSSDFGQTFTFLGQAFGGQLTELDLGSISFTGQVNAVKIVGLDNGGDSPGFDVAFVQGLEGSVIPDDPIAPIPLPAGLPLLAIGLAGLAVLRRRA